MNRERPNPERRIQLAQRARELRNQSTGPEIHLWRALRASQFHGLQFRRQFRIGEYIADFYCHAHKLVIELDGVTHVDSVEYDAARDSYMTSVGLRVLRFSNDEVLANLGGVLHEIGAACGSV